MNRSLFKASMLIALTSMLAGCDFHRSCAAILHGAETAQDIAAVLVRQGVLTDVASKVGRAVEIGERPVSFACSFIPASPVVVPGG